MIDTPITSSVRKVSRTWDGRPIGHVEKLESEAALRLAISRRVNLIAKQDRARENGRSSSRKISQAQSASLTKRGKGK